MGVGDSVRLEQRLLHQRLIDAFIYNVGHINTHSYVLFIILISLRLLLGFHSFRYHYVTIELYDQGLTPVRLTVLPSQRISRCLFLNAQ